MIPSTRVQAVAERMAEDLSDVRLGCEVDSVSWGSHGVEVAYREGQAERLLRADAAIITVSLGLLKVNPESPNPKPTLLAHLCSKGLKLIASLVDCTCPVMHAAGAKM